MARLNILIHLAAPTSEGDVTLNSWRFPFTITLDSTGFNRLHEVTSVGEEDFGELGVETGTVPTCCRSSESL